MINKFQQGGKQDVIMQFILGLALALLADPNLIIQIAQLNPKALEAAVQTYQQTQDMNQAAQAFQQGIQAARHGAKLNYIKSLKHQCADDEELYYYKKGGPIVGCGCKKKEGGEIKDENKKESPIAKFKARNGVKVPDDKKILPTDTVHIQNPKTKKMEVRDLSGKHKQFKKLTKEEYQKQSNDKKNDIDTKGYKKGGKTEKDCGGASIVKKFKAARCGSKIKKHQYGGSLNDIPFMLRGTPKGGLPTAPKAKDRYKNGVRDSVAYLGVPGKDESYFGESIKRVTTPDRAKIQLLILFRHSPYDNDTIYTEIPEHEKRLVFLPQVNIIPRKGFSFAQTPEYEILKRRFNTAWNLAK